ncbi:MAG: hypothetical protein K2M30_00445 [Desulfovibrionaceae bacterium]|nr:hypothetical protein [Desulfovibrionaceae bacterium]
MISVRCLITKFNSLADGLRQAVESGFNGRVIRDLLQQPQNKYITQVLSKTTPPPSCTPSTVSFSLHKPSETSQSPQRTVHKLQLAGTSSPSRIIHHKDSSGNNTWELKTDKRTYSGLSAVQLEGMCHLTPISTPAKPYSITFEKMESDGTPRWGLQINGKHFTGLSTQELDSKIN